MSPPARAARASWLELPAKLLSEDGTILLREPRHANVSELMRRLRAGAYDKPFVVDNGVTRRLHFSLDFVQSEMTIADPDALKFVYTRQMMAFLLFVTRPRHIAIVGLGGGSLSKFCHRRLPGARITTVEIDGDVLAFAKLFELPHENERFRIVHADAADYFATTEDLADVVLIDGCDRSGVAPSLASEAFYRDVAARLRPRGLLVMNLIGPEQSVEAHLRLAAQFFAGRLMLHRLKRGGNRLLFAFKDPRFVPDWIALDERARALEARHGLDFPAFARQLRGSRQIQLG
ncbi:fused MFS/spermidine synthase [Solimonas soli]|uniref:fused MFS/spermidine synthase n=1 Tax=Solimonas soli TaxID=413479 RepID=UPI0004885618|nr:fused MFS/spermidine synthase [Solimonas soli]